MISELGRGTSNGEINNQTDQRGILQDGNEKPSVLAYRVFALPGT